MEEESRTVGFKVHPRVTAALGRDLVMNDVVAVMELVKNAYDALATTVELRFKPSDDGMSLTILDDGMGMTREIVEDVWCVIATPYRRDRPQAAEPERGLTSSHM